MLSDELTLEYTQTHIKSVKSFITFSDLSSTRIENKSE